MHEQDGGNSQPQASPDLGSGQLESLDRQRVPAQRRPPADRGQLSTARSTEAAPLDVRVVFAPAVTVIRLHGELDLSTVHQLHDAVDTLATTTTTGHLVVLDLQGLGFCDAQGLAAINQARLKIAEIGKELILQNLPDTLRKLLDITGLGREFKST